jgi:multicomponent Na+:H+ antiporter subunit C
VNANLTLVVLTAVLYSVGVYLILERSLTRVVLGVLVLGNATNLLLLSAGGAAGSAPIIGLFAPAQMSDPLAQAMILTAIVINLGLAAFLLALIHRNWQLGQQQQKEGDVAGVDELVDDEEDLRIALLAAGDEIGVEFEDFQEFDDDAFEDSTEDDESDGSSDSDGLRSAP